MKMRAKNEWFDDDAFWIGLYPVIFSEQRFSEAADQADKLLKLANPQGRKVLDLCCGPGRFSIPLASKGFEVTGVDRTAFLLKKARARARKAPRPSDISTIDSMTWTSCATRSRTSSRAGSS
jgi:SAM-dependent methyltransferase